MKIHNFKLNDKPFESILNGNKTIELRLFDKKRQVVDIGDVIIFNGKLTVKVIELHRFNDFEELYNNLDLLKCGYNKDNIASASYKDMEEYYSKREIKKYGVVGIEFVKIELWDAYDKNLNVINNKYLIRGEVIPKNVYHSVCEIVVKHKDNTYLLMQRDFRKHFGGMWELTAGGSAIAGEVPMECAKRELFEETGTKADKLEQIGIVVDDEKHTIYHEFLCETNCDKNSVKLQEGETINYKWVNFEELKDIELASRRTFNCLNK